ncbi:benzoate 4-monooxygenase cytochrome P450 [Ephemerocybe angulata]|uniref:Benzoate 4-monooxygenase cytochrome P450 n=1 Tax=Ephemerocybe angulata TaxID=980116 RepID=A0A8H6ICB2_9AGAR|nr:benzoate 4-monooxygenase cytochrome P450 [Tulosesus angulatus]
MTLGATWSICAYSLAFLSLWLVLVFIRRAYLHPLSCFPGPRLAAWTPLYKAYYEAIKGGQWVHHVDKLHEAYGDVVRVGPNELHFNDYRVYHKIFSISGQFTKDPSFYSCFGVGMSTFGLMDPEQARLSRELMSTYFSRRAVLQLESVIQSKVDKLIQLLSSRENPSDMFYAFRCATMDIITTYCFQSPLGCLDSNNFKAPLLTDIQTAVSLLWTMKSFPWIIPVIPFLPTYLGGRLQEQCQAFLNVQSFVNTAISVVQQNAALQDTRKVPQGIAGVFDCLLERFPSLGAARLFHEGLSLIQAGSDPVANTCIVGFFHVLKNPSIHSRLKKELQAAFPGPNAKPGWTELERIPYLTAILKESLRMSHGFVSPLPRVVGPLGAELAGHQIPPKTIVSISAVSVHNHRDLFPEPHRFRPERWLESKDLSQHLVAFSKGPRMCLGLNMAWAELYAFFGTMFLKLDMVLVDASPDDYADFHDYFIPIHTGKNLHIQVTQSS